MIEEEHIHLLLYQDYECLNMYCKFTLSTCSDHNLHCSQNMYLHVTDRQIDCMLRAS